MSLETEEAVVRLDAPRSPGGMEDAVLATAWWMRARRRLEKAFG